MLICPLNSLIRRVEMFVESARFDRSGVGSVKGNHSLRLFDIGTPYYYLIIILAVCFVHLDRSSKTVNRSDNIFHLVSHLLVKIG